MASNNGLYQFFSDPGNMAYSNNPEYVNNPEYLSNSAYQYNYKFGDFLSGAMAAGKQASAQSLMDAKEWQRNEYSAAQQRAFELYMDSTKTQRAMEDIKAAGLNPWLALQSAGLGGSVPTGAAASSSAGQAAAGQSGSQALMGLGTAALGISALIKTIAKIIK